MTQGVSPGGSYQTYPNFQVVAASSIPSFTLTGSVSNTPMASLTIPGGLVGPDGEIEIFVKWSRNNTANGITVTAQLGNTTLEFSDTRASATSVTEYWRIGARGSTASEVGPGPQGITSSTSSFSVLAKDLAQDQTVTIFAQLANAGDNMRVESFSIAVRNPLQYNDSRLSSTTPIFYGINGHFDDSQTIAQHIADMQTLGITMYRCTYEGSATSLNYLVNLAKALQGTGIQLYCCIDLSMTSDGTNLWGSEQLAYQYAYGVGMQVAGALAPLGVVYFECGNELDTKNGVQPTGGTQGGVIADFSAAVWPILRGVVAGCMAGIRALALPGVQCASNAFTRGGLAAMDMLWFGTAPDGSSGYLPVRWDITAFHNYEDYGSLLCMSLDFAKPYANILEHLSRVYQRPIVISEWNGKASDTDVQRAAWASRFMTEMYTNRFKYNVASIMVYELYGSPWAVMSSPGNVLSTFGTTVQSFIAANPDTSV